MIFLNIYDEWLQSSIVVTQLLDLTNEKILIRTDGFCYKEFANWLKLFANRVGIVQGDKRLKVAGNGGLLGQTWLKLFLLLSTDSYLIKIDPDTGINRAPMFPSRFEVSCNYRDDHRYLLGGALLFSRDAVEKIVKSELMLDRKYQSREWCYRWRHQEWIPCEDAILYDVIHRLGLDLSWWDDVYCCHSNEVFSPPRPLNSYSFYHPIERK